MTDDPRYAAAPDEVTTEAINGLRVLNDEMPQPVTIDHGDLLEICQAAEAWAKFARLVKNDDSTADRIDKAIHNATEAAMYGGIR